MIVLQSLHNQVFQDWIFPIDDYEEPIRPRSRQPEADSADAIALHESEGYLFVICSMW
jgi:hypothetical protein